MNNDISSVSTSVSGTGQSEKANGLAYQHVSEAQAQSQGNDPRPAGDAITLSAQAMGLADNATRTAPVAGRQIGVDSSGSYKLD